MIRCRKRKSATHSLLALQICTPSAILQRTHRCVAEFAMQIFSFFVVLEVLYSKDLLASQHRLKKKSRSRKKRPLCYSCHGREHYMGFDTVRGIRFFESAKARRHK